MSTFNFDLHKRKVQAGRELEEAFQLISGEVNSNVLSDDEIAEGIKTILQREHRTLEQGIVKALYQAFVKLADNYDQKYYDARNEASTLFYKAVRDDLPEQYFPYI